MPTDIDPTLAKALVAVGVTVHVALAIAGWVVRVRRCCGQEVRDA